MEQKRKRGRPPKTKRKLVSSNKTSKPTTFETPVIVDSDTNVTEIFSNGDLRPSKSVLKKIQKNRPSILKKCHAKKASQSHLDEIENTFEKNKLPVPLQSIQNGSESSTTPKQLTLEEFQKSSRKEWIRDPKKSKVSRRKFLPFEDNENSLLEFISVQNGINNKEPQEITAELILNNSIFRMRKSDCGMKPGNLPRPTSSGDDKWVPPRSPYFLIQEQLSHDPWKMLIATLLLEHNKGQKVIPTVWKFFNHWPTPEKLQYAKVEDVSKCLLLGGLNHTMAETIVQFSHEFLMKTWTYPIELHGIGNYSNDSYRIFCVNEWKQVHPDDIKLQRYIKWLHNNSLHFGLN